MRWALLALLVMAGCDGRGGPPEPLRLQVPANLGRPLPSPARNPMTAPGVALGKQLFFDRRLSGNNQIACATCHEPARAFSDGKRRSQGASGEPLPRNTPSLANLAWMSGYFWDGGAKDLESQVFAPLTSPDEMAQSPAELLTELRADPDYPAEFARAFPDGLTIANVVRAVAQYERTLVSAGSRYDRFVRGEPGGVLDDLERRGRDVVTQRCARCHVPDFFTDFDYHNTGLDDRYPDAFERTAWGRGRITRDASDIGKYKTPTLRNVALTAPYMHDGRFATLEEVIDHYRSGVRISATLDPVLAAERGIPITGEEKAAVVAFLRTLTDEPVTP